MLRAVSLLCLLLIALPALAQTVWEMPTEYPANSMPGEGIATFARLVGRKSGGRLVVQPSFDAGKGIKSAGLLAAVRDGRVQAADAFAGALDAVHPIFALSSLPFLATSIEDAKRLADLARPAYEAVLAASGQKLLYVTPWPPSGLWSKRPVSNADELARLSIRTYDATSTAVMRAAGANAANLSFADAVPKLRDGTLDAALSSGDGGAGRRLWEMLPYFTDINYAVPLSLATVSTASYEALPEELRRAVDSAAAETEARQWATIRTRLSENYARMASNGVTISTAVPQDLQAALRRAAQGAIDDWLRQAGPSGAAILAAYRKR